MLIPALQRMHNTVINRLPVFFESAKYPVKDDKSPSKVFVAVLNIPAMMRGRVEKPLQWTQLWNVLIVQPILVKVIE